MEDDRAEQLLIQISEGDRDALKVLFDETAPAVAARLAFGGQPMRAAENAIVTVYADIWQGEYSVPLRRGQRVVDWLAALAMSQLPEGQPGDHGAAPISQALWQRVKRRAFPENWRNLLRRSDVLFAVIGALIWALILKFVVN